MRVLVVHSYYRQRGGEDVVFDCEVSMLRSGGTEVHTFERHNEDLATRGALGNARNTIWNAKVAREIADQVHRHRIDVVHFHNTFPAISAAALPAARNAGAATVQTLHNFRLLCVKAVCFRNDAPCFQCFKQPFAISAIVNRCFQNSHIASGVVASSNTLHRRRRTYQKHLDLAIAPSQFVRQSFETSGYPIAPIVIKPHFVEAETHPGDGWGGYALYVGRLSDEKGIRMLLEAWDELSTPIELRIIGEGPLSSLLTDRGVQLCDDPVSRVKRTTGSVSPIVWLGQRDQAEVYEAMAMASMLILPSQCAESFGRVVIEAFARGTPVICSNVGGQSELVTDATGICFTPGSRDALVRAVEAMAQREDLRTNLRTEARSQYELHYTADANFHQLMSIYQNSLAIRHQVKTPEFAPVDSSSPGLTELAPIQTAEAARFVASPKTSVRA